MIKYDYPENIKLASGIGAWFAEYNKKRFGNEIKLNKAYYSYVGEIVKRMKEDNNISLTDVATIVWGVCNTEGKTKKLGYCTYFADKLDEYKELKEQYYKEKDKEVEEVEYHEIKHEKGDNPLEEFLR